MSIVKKNFMVIGSILSLVLLFFACITYHLFRLKITDQYLETQTLLVQSNSQISANFTQTINQLVYQYSSDEEMGLLLSRKIGKDALYDSNTKTNLNNRITYYLNSQNNLLTNDFSIVLYLNPNLEVSKLFYKKNTIVNISHVLNANLVQNEQWYQTVLHSVRGKYIFLDEQKENLCFAFKLQNRFYTGPHNRDGVGVILGKLPIDKISSLLSLTSITEHSGFVLLDEKGNSIYQSIQLPKTCLPELTRSRSGEIVKLDEKEYLVSVEKLDWGIKLAFLIPYSDIVHQVQQIMVPYLYFAMVFLLIGAVCSFALSKNISNPFICLNHKIERIKDIREVDQDYFSIKAPKEIKQLSSSFARLTQRINSLITQVQEAEIKQKESELRALQAQINPHFILNAMNAVNAMALMNGQDNIASTVDSIANLMRYSITEPDSRVSIYREIENIQQYISIYTLRFRQKILLETQIECSAHEAFIPKFTLQPLVENSIRHGIKRQNEGIQIIVHAYMQNDNLYVDVIDNGVGADCEKMNQYLRYEAVDLHVSHGFGIRNINERLRLHYGQSSGLQYLYSEEGRFTARITIPTHEKSTL